MKTCREMLKMTAGYHVWGYCRKINLNVHRFYGHHAVKGRLSSKTSVAQSKFYCIKPYFVRMIERKKLFGFRLKFPFKEKLTIIDTFHFISSQVVAIILKLFILEIGNIKCYTLYIILKKKRKNKVGRMSTNGHLWI